MDFFRHHFKVNLKKKRCNEQTRLFVCFEHNFDGAFCYTGFFNSSQLKLSYTMTESILTLNCGQVLTKVDFFIQNFKKNSLGLNTRVAVSFATHSLWEE